MLYVVQIPLMSAMFATAASGSYDVPSRIQGDTKEEANTPTQTDASECDSGGPNCHQGLYLLQAHVDLRRDIAVAQVKDALKFSADEGLTIQYLRVANHSTIAETFPLCDYWEPEYLATKVDDKCCDLSQWPDGSGASQTPPDPRTNPWGPTNKTWTCYVQERVPPNDGTYIRNFAACVKGIPVLAEDCFPDGTTFGDGYPIEDETVAAKSFEDGTLESCNCGTKYVGEGCFVGMTSSIAGIAGDLTANFVKVEGASYCT